MTRSRIARLALAAASSLTLLVPAAPGAAAVTPQQLCHKTVVKQLEKYKKTYLKLHLKCLDKDNDGAIAGPCPDATTAAKIALANAKVTAKIAAKCTMQHLADLGYRGDCAYGPATAGVAGQCAALAVTTPAEFAECMKCWKSAEFGRFMAIVYASHAEELCGAALDDTSAVCAALGCTAPRPDQRDLGDGAENDCQRALGKGGVKYLLKREKALEKCLLKNGGTLAACEADPTLQLKLAKFAAQLESLVASKCGGNRVPDASPPFCCRTGTANSCTVAASRVECTEVLEGTVQDGKVCGISGTCDNPPGNDRPFTWWEHCPSNDPCPGATLGDMDEVVGCVEQNADELVAGVICLQFPDAGACPTPTTAPTPTVTPTP